MPGRKKRGSRNIKIMLSAMGITVLALLILTLAAYLLIGGKAVSSGTESEQADQETDVNEEDPESLYEPEENGEKVAVSTVKKIASETDKRTVGIDVSEFQGTIDWKQVADSGVEFAMIRCGYRSLGSGEIREDACARYNLQEANANGIQLGAYFFSTAVTTAEAEEEAQWMSDLLAGYPITYPVVYNCEGFQDSSSRQYGLSVDERSAIADAFLKKAEANAYTGMFYAARNELVNNTLWNTDALELAYRIWVAQYGSAQTDVPEYPGNFAMWQYTNQGSVPGISTYVDLNVAYFGYSETAEAQEEGSAQHVEADPEVGVKFDEVSEQVTSKDTTNLRSTMDQGDDSNVVATLKNGETALRTGIGNNGWSRVEYNGEKLYAVSSYLTADLAYQTPVKEPDDGFKTQFTRVSENVTAKDVTNLRNRPSVEEPSEVIAQLHNGEVVVRTGVSDVGWSRVEYNGQILYCVSSYLQLTE